MTLSKYQVAAFHYNGRLDIMDSKEFATREEAEAHLAHLQTIYKAYMAVVKR